MPITKKLERKKKKKRNADNKKKNKLNKQTIKERNFSFKKLSHG